MVLGCFKDNTVFALTLMVTGLAQTVEKSDSTINCRKKTPLGLIHAVTITKRLTYSLNLIT